MLFAISHEAVHALKLSNLKGYTELKNYVMDVLTDSGMNIDSRTVAVINNYLETNSLNRDNLTEEAEEEIVANAFGSIISNEKAMKKAYSLPSSKKKNLVSAIKSIISKLKEFLNKLSNQMPEVKALKDNINAQIKMAEIFAKNIEQHSTDEQKKNTHSNENRTDVVDNKIKYSVNPKFADEVDRAFKDGTIKDKTFILGETSDVLQALGARENSIYMNGDKMVTILSKHPEMSINTIKNIPKLIDNPVLVLKSKNKVDNNSRVVVFGRYKAENGKPMLAVIDLLPREDKLVINDMQKLVSSYTKTKNPTNKVSFSKKIKYFFENSDVLYVTENKKVAKNLIGRVGFLMPTELRHFGYIGNIAYTRNKVKLSGVPFIEVFKYDEISDTKTIQKLGANLPGKKFSIFEDGTDKNLVAMHNLSADNLETALKRGGLPMPSIAVTKDSISHNDFGDVSVLFDKDTIDPEQDNNYVYGSDVFSPTHPGLEYKVNENKGREVYQYIRNLIKKALDNKCLNWWR